MISHFFRWRGYGARRPVKALRFAPTTTRRKNATLTNLLSAPVMLPAIKKSENQTGVEGVIWGKTPSLTPSVQGTRSAGT